MLIIVSQATLPIGEFEIVIQLNGRLNRTGVISPRFTIQVTQIENGPACSYQSADLSWYVGPAEQVLGCATSSAMKHEPHDKRMWEGRVWVVVLSSVQTTATISSVPRIPILFVI